MRWSVDLLLEVEDAMAGGCPKPRRRNEPTKRDVRRRRVWSMRWICSAEKLRMRWSVDLLLEVEDAMAGGGPKPRRRNEPTKRKLRAPSSGGRDVRRRRVWSSGAQAGVHATTRTYEIKA
ncbi:hypothetical protein GUJ93_ZPchr0458g22793 [Zizania palustris]|uniref:Uncharacterized protein n=1 Tax=Zizania palustris TaxID=103762 RepID=A0A8J5UZQ1_ZIZPA|nr:hypothetical protein GUJ93_ZPchr0458g22793 [Zizania palustris]